MKKLLPNGGKNINDPKEVVKLVKEKLNCPSESCILTNPQFKKIVGNVQVIRDELEMNFKPPGPANNIKELFNNFNIDDVLDQLEKANPGFLHIPFQMRDFAKVSIENRNLLAGIRNDSDDTNLATIDLAKKYLHDKMTHFGVVINTDISSGPGVHWFSIFGDFRQEPFTIEYFNSSGNLPLIEISEWMKSARIKLEQQLSKKIKEVIVSRIEMQHDDYSCGPYSVYYIYSRIKGIPYEYFSKNRVGDEEMYKFRKHIFRDNKYET